MFKKLFKKAEHKITLIAEFKPELESEAVISQLSRYIYKIIRTEDSVLLDLQSIPSGYRAMFTIQYKTNFFRRKNYTKELSNLHDWFGNDKSRNGCLSRYHYTCV